MVGRVFRFVLKTIGSILLLLTLTVISLYVYFQFNKHELFKDLPVLNQGLLTFEVDKIQILKHFPLATVNLKNVTLRDSLYEKHHSHLFDFGELSVGASLQNIFNRQLIIQSIHLKDGYVHVFSDSTGYGNLKNLLRIEKSAEKEGHVKDFTLITDHFKISFSNIYFDYSEALNNRFINGDMKYVNADIQSNGKNMDASFDMDLCVNEITFNKLKGSYLENSDLSGIFNLERKDSIFNILPFDLKINDQLYTFGGAYNTQETNGYTLYLENKYTTLEDTSPLLASNIQEKLRPYKIDEPFYSKTTILGNPVAGYPPIVQVDFVIKKSTVQINDYSLKVVTTSGFFKNRIYDDERAWTEDKKRYKVNLENLIAEYDAMSIVANQVSINNTQKAGLWLKANMKVTGNPSSISKWFHNDQFFFRKGKFELDATVSGPVKNYNQIIIESKADLKLDNFYVIYKPADAAFPFKRLELEKERGDADFKIVSSTPENGHVFKIDGGIKNVSAVLLELAQRASSDVLFVADKISWTDFLNLFGENGYLTNNAPKSDRQKKKSMKETIRGIQYDFQPRVVVKVDTLQYFDFVEVYDFKSGIHFENEHTLVLEKTSFRYGDGNVDFHAKIDISQSDISPFEFELHTEKLNLNKLLPAFNYFNIQLLSDIEKHAENVSIDIEHTGIMDDQKGLIPGTSTGKIIFKIDNGETLLGRIDYEPGTLLNGNQSKVELGGNVKTKIALEGKPYLFNKFLKTNRFFFNKGNFFAKFEYVGNITNFENLLSQGDAHLDLMNSEVYYKETDVTFPLTKIELDLHKNNADFYAYLFSPSPLQEINLNGTIKNISELAIGNTGKQIKTIVNVDSPILRWEQFLGIFTPINKEKTDSINNAKTLKSTAKGLLTTFEPDLSVYLDTFIYSDKLLLRELQTGIHVQDSATIILDKTGFKFIDGSVNMEGKMDLSREDHIPFSGIFNTAELDVAGLLEGLNYLNLPSFRNVEKLSGQTNMNLDLSGILAENAASVTPEKMNGLLDFELSDIVIQGFLPLDKIAAKIMMKKRFKTVRFAPIANSLNFQGQDIQIPLMEIRSNAITMFLEGTLSYGDNTNIWVTIPLSNLTAGDLSTIPDKKDYAAFKWKIYVEVTTDEFGENQFKLRFSKRKFYKQRGILEQYKLDKRKYKERRKRGF